MRNRNSKTSLLDYHDFNHMWSNDMNVEVGPRCAGSLALVFDVGCFWRGLERCTLYFSTLIQPPIFGMDYMHTNLLEQMVWQGLKMHIEWGGVGDIEILTRWISSHLQQRDMCTKPIMSASLKLSIEEL